MQLVKVVNQTRGTIVGESVKVADTSLSRMVGLLRSRELKAGGGLWIKPSSGVHTIGMSFAIDVVGLDKRKRVVKLWPRLVPFRITSVHLNINSVIELAAGQIDRCEIQLGDLIEISELSSPCGCGA
jgi:uncharacterized membrane protein (UPF0127 family)